MATGKNKFAHLLGEVGLPATGKPMEPAATKVGKRSDPSYKQISTYVRTDLYKIVRRDLLMEDRDFSDLIDELLSEWVSKRQAK